MNFFAGLKEQVASMMAAVQSGDPFRITFKGVGISQFALKSLENIFLMPIFKSDCNGWRDPPRDT